jgi:hypothetical protein
MLFSIRWLFYVLTPLSTLFPGPLQVFKNDLRLGVLLKLSILRLYISIKPPKSNVSNSFQLKQGSTKVRAFICL